MGILLRTLKILQIKPHIICLKIVPVLQLWNENWFLVGGDDGGLQMSGLTPGIMIKQCRVHEPILTRVIGLLTHPIHTKPIPQEHPVGVLTMPIFELIRYL